MPGCPFSAPRVWWSLRVMGFPNVYVLDGGLPKWRTEGHPVETEPTTATPVPVDPAFDPSLLRDLEAVQAHLATGDAQVVDARAAARKSDAATVTRWSGVKGCALGGRSAFGTPRVSVEGLSGKAVFQCAS